MAQYLYRIADGLLKEKLEAFGAVLIEGPKWCGKTTTAAQQAASILQMQDPDNRESYLATAATKPSLLLKGENPRLIDEWQIAPVLWDSVRVEVDRRNEPGQFILTGSNSFDHSQVMHSGTGRIARMKMYPMSLWESGESNGKISLSELFNNLDYDIDGITSDLSIEQLIFAACRGGFPATLNLKTDKARLQVAEEYLNSVCETDIVTVDGVQRNPKLMKLILKSYARNICTLSKKSNILKDVQSSFENLSMVTFDDYVNVLQKLFVTQDLAAWNPSIRSATVIRSGHKRNLADPSMAIAALGIKYQQLLLDLKTFGFIFESLAIRDLKAYSFGIGGKLSFYNDRYGLEADAVLHLPDGRYALIEVKLGSQQIEEGAKHLIELRRLVQEFNKREQQVRLREPDLLMVITGGQMAYTRSDGVKIVPIGCLKP
jgi:predicted AAA+ superfamily ATPase